ncbi:MULTISPECIES: hypothetical protein [unclassified Paenibacillus]|uniref:hypothetical protein n=1 Tax=unclassified Paenibacillus TaxID=185978 RepID=UPI0012FE26CD|nr:MULTISPECIES: hypothetical protein [unclassified Paenibacillus]QID16031.1 hypothetical protein CIC07_25195 [Paenibacillus sp. RUD330]
MEWALEEYRVAADPAKWRVVRIIGHQIRYFDQNVLFKRFSDIRSVICEQLSE